MDLQFLILLKKEKDVFALLTKTYVKFKDTDYTQKAIRILHSPIITLTIKTMILMILDLVWQQWALVDVNPKNEKIL